MATRNYLKLYAVTSTREVVAMLKIAILIAIAMALICTAARAGDEWDWDDMFAPYRQRLDTMTTSSGNAQAVNTAIHVINFWPPYVHNRRIPGDGARAAGAIARYKDGGKQRLPRMARSKDEQMAIEMSIEGPIGAKTSTSSDKGSGDKGGGGAIPGGLGAIMSGPSGGYSHEK